MISWYHNIVITVRFSFTFIANWTLVEVDQIYRNPTETKYPSNQPIMAYLPWMPAP